MGCKLGIARLRTELPHWTWTALRVNFGTYRYRGQCAGRTIHVQSVDAVGYECDDEVYIRHYVHEDGQPSESYDMWRFYRRNAHPAPELPERGAT